jgi:DNA-3-methyladenine glycosylase
MTGKKLPRRFYTRPDTLQVARELLGKLLVVPSTDGKRVSGIIVETEAYMGPEDKGSHAYGNRRTNRTEPMFALGGCAYVYFVYGMHHQFNVVVNADSVPHAVLIRALEPYEGLDVIERRRGNHTLHNLTNGPGKLCSALGIDLSYNREDLLGDRIWIEKTGRPISISDIDSGPRIGIDYAEEYVQAPWRFWLKNNRFVSKLAASTRKAILQSGA